MPENNHFNRTENAKIRNMPNVKGNRILKKNMWGSVIIEACWD